jgi:hypothetical protein
MVGMVEGPVTTVRIAVGDSEVDAPNRQTVYAPVWIDSLASPA